eukprot:g9121.t1
MTTSSGACRVDQTVFVQILNAFSARKPCALISDSEYNECLEQLVNNESQEHDGYVQQRRNNEQKTCALQDRLGTKLFIKNKRQENILVAGSKTRHLELIPFSKVYVVLEELTEIYKDQRTLQQTVKETVLGIPEEIVQEYYDMALANPNVHEQTTTQNKEGSHTHTHTTIRRCSACNIEKSVDEFLPDEKEPSGLRTRCKDCDPRTRHKKKVKLYPGEEFIQDDQTIPESTPIGFSGTAICAACGMRKSVTAYDKERSKPLAIRCKDCVKNEVPLRSKVCSSCQRDLTLDHFYRDSYTKAGFRPRCTECMRPRKGTPRVTGRRVSTRAQQGPQSRTVADQDDASMDFEMEQNQVPSKQKRSRRKKKPSSMNMDMIVDSPISQKDDVKKEEAEGMSSTRSGRTRQRSRLNRGAESNVDKTHPVNSISTKTRGDKSKTKGVSVQEQKPVVRHRERSKPFSGSTVKDEFGNWTKYCTGCRLYKLTEEFGRDCSKTSGLRSRCRNCQRRRNRPIAAALASDDDINEAPIALRKIPRKPNKRRKPGQKICIKCDLEKSTSDFYRDRSQSDGLSPSCKRCSNASKKKPQYKSPQSSGVNKQPQGYGPQVQEENIDHVLNYVDALLPESSEESAGLGEFPEDDEIELNSIPVCGSHRICVGCKVDKSWIEFNPNPTLPGGLCPLCKDCLRGNGMRGRRATKQRPKRRQCVRCKRPRSSIHFAQSLFFPNRITLVCDDCRAAKEQNSSSVCKRDRDGIWKALDIMDYECDALRVRDPGGGEKLWRDIKSESELEEHKRKKRKMKQNGVRKNGLPNTELKLEKNGVTMTHHIPGENWMKSALVTSMENLAFKEDKKRRKPTVLEKQCKLCGEIKRTDEFAPDSSKTCRVSSQCIECTKRGL